MKQKYLTLSLSIAAALACTPAALMAQPSAAGNAASTGEAGRITQVVNSTSLVTLPKTHLGFVGKKSAVNVADSTKMNHLQLILKPSALRQAQMETLIANQHNPKSAQFQKWLTPAQFGNAYGAVDSDIAAVTAWLTSQGFTVNSVYPNKTQIDFSGTAAQVRAAFHTQEGIYTIGKQKHLANSSDISIPAALKSVVAGVMGLNDFHPKSLHKKSEIAQWNTSKKGFVSKAKNAADAKSGAKVINQAISFNGGALRGLVPDDVATMYNVAPLRANGVTGAGVTIAVVEDENMVPADWDNFRTQFNLAQYGGTFAQVAPPAASGPNNCIDPGTQFGTEDGGETLLDAEWSTAIAPGANIVVASCSDYDADFDPATDNFFGGTFIAATNLINQTSGRPNIISASYGYGEYFTDTASKTAIDLMWAQADAEGISVFVSTGDSGSNPSFNGGLINGYYGNSAVDANSFATSPHVTGVGGLDTADVLDGTTSKYFAPTTNPNGGSALSYVPEIPWNQSCGNGVAAKSVGGFSSALDFCKEYLKYDPNGAYATSEAGSGGPSSVDAKPAWQRQIFNAAKDQSRDLPDVSLFAGSYGGYTYVVTCTSYYPCTPDYSGSTALSGGTSLASPMFAGIQALMDQGLAARGLPINQGNAAPTLYALAANEYGGATGTSPASLAACSADNGATGTDSCVFHNVTRGSISTQCYQPNPALFTDPFTTANCYFYGTVGQGADQLGLTTTDAAPTAYGVANKAYGAQPGWSFAAGLGSVNARNLLIAWRAFVNAPPAPPPAP
ncbi:S53 family peptidase [Rhodanobacter sp. L36]|uniref:S53 family peptidase n=1 Tax=Rhodanobacter sp. L36 TaxID=1747221 RepID=UPI00131BFB39|nr:S53 family peptidase [Rhodanobacter sp. L36]